MRQRLSKWQYWPWMLWIAYGGALAVLQLAMAPLTQDPAYHQFADTRSFLGIPRFGDVISNLAILGGGLAGLVVMRRRPEPPSLQRTVWAVFFAAIVLTAAGSAYYHWQPDSTRLVWDRLPLGLVTASFPVLVLAERASIAGPARWALWAWLAWGPLSVLYWSFGDAQGLGDLRPYGLLKLYGMASCLALLGLLARRHTLGWLYVAALALYVLAGIAEARDVYLFVKTGWISGHTLKHALAGIAVATLAAMLAARKPVRL